LQPLPSDTAESTRRPPISEEHMRRLIDVRRDIVHTIRQAVDIVSKYAGGALPEPARTRVRGFILTLPQRWASKAGGTGGVTAGSERDSTVTAAASGTGSTRRPGGQRRAAHRERGIEGDLRSGASSRAPSPSSSPRISRTAVSRRSSNSGDVGEGGEGGRVPAGTALVAAQRILVLAIESLDMMRNVTGVMKDSLDRAEAYVLYSHRLRLLLNHCISRWVNRLRTVGIQRDTLVEDTEYEFSQQGQRRSDEPDQDTPGSPFFSTSSTVWGSSIPSTPAGDSFTPAYASAASPGMTIPIGAMSLSSRYETPRSGILSLPGEEEEEEEEEDMVQPSGVADGEIEEDEGKMDVDG
jgi:transcriptional repressor OPI1